MNVCIYVYVYTSNTYLYVYIYIYIYIHTYIPLANRAPLTVCKPSTRSLYTPHSRTANFNEPRVEAAAAAASVITLPGSTSPATAETY